MGQVIELVSESAVDAAWQSYAETAVQLIGNPSLIADRAYNEKLALRHEKWVRLFLMQERVK